MTDSSPWLARRIYLELCDTERRRAIARAFWRFASPEERAQAAAALAQAMRFREPALRKAPVEKRADWLLARLNDPRFGQFFEVALVAYHTGIAKELLAACLDQWGVPHKDGLIEAEEPPIPSEEAIESSLPGLAERFPMPDLLLYLASAGLLMGDAWAKACWPVVDRHRPAPAAG
jgi:hypothetical protein